MTSASGRRTPPSALPGVCTECPLLCDDVVPDGVGLANACAAGTAARARAVAAAGSAPAWIDGVPTDLRTAVAEAATLLVSARRVLVTGLAAATLEAVAGACDLAETLGAAVDAGTADTARPSGPMLARLGGVTADWEELRDRADLVIVWFHDPAASHPRLWERFVEPPLPDGRRRRVVAIGPAADHRQMPLPAAAATDAARTLGLLLSGAGGSPPPTGGADPAVATACAAVHAAIAEATCVAIVTGPTGDDTGIDAWSSTGLVQAVAHRMPAFEIPLGSGVAGGVGGNVAGAAAVCTWRYGAAGGIARADRDGGEFRPAEDDAVRLVTRGEVDAVLAVGTLPAGVETAIRAAEPDLAVVRVCDGGAAIAGGGRRVQLRSASLLVAPEGTMLRGDGRWTPLAAATPPRPGSLAALLTALLAAVRQASPRHAPVRGGEP